MSYTPTQWKAGDTVTSAKLNKMEQGIASGANILIAHVIETTQESDDPKIEGTSVPVIKLDKTAREILDADYTIIPVDSQDGTITQRVFTYIDQITFDSETGEFQFIVPVDGQSNTFHAATEDDYPEIIFLGNGTLPNNQA